MAHIKQIQSHLTVSGTLFDPYAAAKIIAFCTVSNSGDLRHAFQLFRHMPYRTTYIWNVVIRASAENNESMRAVSLYSDMIQSGFLPNNYTFSFLLRACADLSYLSFGLALHCHAIRLGWESHDFVQNGLIHLYVTCDFINPARKLFDVSGRWIHAYVNRKGMQLDRVLGTALVDMYNKCGCIETARAVFNEMPSRDVFAFTSLISGLANNGDSAGAISLFARMQDEGIAPNEVTFICVLSACSRMGLVDEGLRIFGSMTSTFRIQPGIQHYGCLVDLLGRAGMLEEAKKVVREMPMEPDSYVLGALLNACRVHGDVELDHSGVHVLLSNIYASANQWDDVTVLRKGMEEKKVRKVPGCSLVEVNGEVFEFVAGDRSHVLMDEIMLASLVIDKHLKSRCFDRDDDKITE
ncbi:pentatricopeptide repeat-containing protein [Prunus yedoensis var. nudiflora]|uniref:Pentatricopeptide repeat-containing protein n=1 Tax=Prunus yedoensis var. nudiflora TaxID=2094558 RepID=A0A314UE05_PRUYE|nr:pentatricopeptide repeat-containing protein [Prunus yedoensis var. nudiflora]